MPLQTRVMVSAGRGAALHANLLGAQAGAEISNAIGQVNAGNMFGAVGGIPGLGNIFGWRVDRQNAPGGFVNVSVQRNGVPAPSTIASVFVPGTYNIAVPGAHLGAAAITQYNARMRELARAVRRGLEESFATYALPAGQQATVAGQPNNARDIARIEVYGVFSS
jgi:hypothetical protein